MSLTKVINTGIKNAEITGSKINTSSSFSVDSLQANTITVVNEFYSNSVNSAFNTANAAFNYANTIAGGSAIDNVARTTSNSASSYANGAYATANLKFNSTGGLISGDVTISGNIVPTTDVTYNIGNSSNRIHTIFVGPGSVDIDGIILSNNNGQLTVTGATDFSIQGLPATSDISDKINLVFDSANSASVAANTPSQVANTASSYANGSFAAANVADQRAVTSGDYANASYLQANTPSHVANSASSYANGAFSSANVADQKAVTSGSYANAAYAEANVRATTTYVDNAIANLVSSAPVTLDTLNELAIALNNDPSFATTIATNIGIIGNYSNSAYLQANTPSQVANAASSYANGAYGAANTADQKAVTSGSYANSSYSLANTANILAQFSFNSSNLNSSNITVVGSYANSAYGEANAAMTKAFAVEDYSINVNFLTISSYAHTNAAFNTANSASSYANSGYSLANTANTLAQAAYDAANTGGADTWARSSANSASSYANGAFAKSNTANTLAQAAYDAANNAVDTWVRDAANSASSYANSGFGKANTANTLAQAAYDAANNATDSWVRDAANSASSYANGAFVAANTADQRAVTSGVYANGAFVAANTADQRAVTSGSYANDAFVAANTADQKAVTSGSYANSAYLQANTPSQVANAASSYANDAFAQANTSNTNAISAGVYANAAFAAANSSGGGGGGGSGLFNPLINVATGYGVTSTLANAVVFSANAIVHSIYLTNISNVSTSNIQVTGDFTPSGSSNVSIFYKIPLPYRSSVEMLKKPQVVKTNDILKLQSFNNDVGVSANAYAIVVYETTTDVNYERVGKLVTDTYANIYTPTSSPSVIESIKIVNQDSAYGNHAVTIVWTNSANTLQGYLTKELILPANSTVELCETPKYINAGDKFDAFATTTNVMSIFVSAKKII